MKPRKAERPRSDAEVKAALRYLFDRGEIYRIVRGHFEVLSDAESDAIESDAEQEPCC